MMSKQTVRIGHAWFDELATALRDILIIMRQHQRSGKPRVSVVLVPRLARLCTVWIESVACSRANLGRGVLVDAARRQTAVRRHPLVSHVQAKIMSKRRRREIERASGKRIIVAGTASA